MESMESMESQDSLSPISKNFLLATTKWAKIVAIINFVMAGLIAIVAFSLGTIMSTVLSKLPMGGGAEGSAALLSGGAGIFMTVFYLFIAALVAVPAYFLLTFANKTKLALLNDNTEEMEKGMHNIKRYFQFNAILLLIAIVFYLLIFIVAIFGIAAAATAGSMN